MPADTKENPDLVDEAEEVLGYRFGDAGLLGLALTHASSAGHRLESNERMEFLGDAILGWVVCDYLYKNYRDLLEGEMTKIKSAVVSRQVCAKISDKLGLCSLLSLGKGIRKRRELPESIGAAGLEAVMAAIYLDGGVRPVRRFVHRHFGEYIRQAQASAHQENFKSVLQQYTQKSLPTNPVYVLLDTKGPDHSKCFEVCVEIEGRRFDSAWAKSKKEAEQQAALLALEGLGLVDHNGDGQVLLKESLVQQMSSVREGKKSRGGGGAGG